LIECAPFSLDTSTELIGSRLSGFGEMYFVTRVDHEAQVADLLPIVWSKHQLPSVPFLAIELIPGCETRKFKDPEV
jgi:hypothetical protein